MTMMILMERFCFDIKKKLIDVVGSLYLTMIADDDVTSTFNNMIPMNMLLNMFFLNFFSFFL